MDFRGNQEVTIDSKGRIAIPSNYRESLSKDCDGKLVITHNPYRDNKCLVLYPENKWSEVQNKLHKIQKTKKVRDAVSLLVHSAIDVSIDKGGRILIPVQFREQYALTKELVIAGNFIHFQIWNKDLYQKHIEAIDLENLNDIAEFKDIDF